MQVQAVASWNRVESGTAAGPISLSADLSVVLAACQPIASCQAAFNDCLHWHKVPDAVIQTTTLKHTEASVLGQLHGRWALPAAAMAAMAP